MKTYDVVYDWSVGGNDIPQYRHFMKMNPGFKIHIVDEPRALKFDPDYHYNFKQVAIDGIAESGVSFRIEEYYRMTNTSAMSVLVFRSLSFPQVSNSSLYGSHLYFQIEGYGQ